MTEHLTRAEDRELSLRWERETGKCSACGHALSSHNDLSYCRAKSCTCGMANAENRRLHRTMPGPTEKGEGEETSTKTGDVVDLLAALQQSVTAAKQARKKGESDA